MAAFSGTTTRHPPTSKPAAMSTPAVQLFCALLAVAVLAFTVALAGWRVAARRVHRGGRALDAFVPVATGLAAAIAVGCTLGSLYFSEVAHFTPCTMCWYQRIAMYPLAIILVIAAVRRDRIVLLYVAVLASIGAAISTYHFLLERFPLAGDGRLLVGGAVRLHLVRGARLRHPAVHGRVRVPRDHQPRHPRPPRRLSHRSADGQQAAHQPGQGHAGLRQAEHVGAARRRRDRPRRRRRGRWSSSSPSSPRWPSPRR